MESDISQVDDPIVPKRLNKVLVRVFFKIPFYSIFIELLEDAESWSCILLDSSCQEIGAKQASDFQYADKTSSIFQYSSLYVGADHWICVETGGRFM